MLIGQGPYLARRRIARVLSAMEQSSTAVPAVRREGRSRKGSRGEVGHA